ncbi:hypothetical protein ACJX0J_041349, partial [Zea mays]
HCLSPLYTFPGSATAHPSVVLPFRFTYWSTLPRMRRLFLACCRYLQFTSVPDAIRATSP